MRQWCSTHRAPPWHYKKSLACQHE
jgi:hypothetical protein